MSKKRLYILIAVAGSLIVLITILAVVSYLYSTRAIYDNYRNISIQSGWATKDDYSDCDSNFSDPCIVYAYKIIKAGIRDEQTSLQLNSADIDSKLTETTNLLDEKKYSASKKSLKEAVALEKSLVEGIRSSVNNLKNNSSKAFATTSDSVFDIQIRGDWAVVKISRKSVKVDVVTLVLQKIDNNWTVKLGPGTSFDVVDLYTAGASDEIVDIVNNGVVKEKDNLYY